MKNTAIKAILILIFAMCFAGFTACGVSTDSSMGTNYAENVNKKAVKAFKEAKLIKVGEHTYYPDYLFESDDRDKKFKDYILSVLEKCDKDLHDDIFVYIIMEAETKNEFNHVIKDASIITVSLYDGSVYEAQLIGSDDENDIAVIRINPAQDAEEKV